MKVVIIGVNGKIGKILCKKLRQTDGFEPTAFIRKLEQKTDFDEMDVPVIVESLENIEEAITEKLKGFDAVVFTAGSGGKTGYDKTIEIDFDGAVKVINAAKANNINRFVMISAAHADNRSFWEQSAIKPYYIAKHYADKELVRSGLEYTIIRPVLLTDDETISKINMEANPANLGDKISRVTVAEVILNVLKTKSGIYKILEISEGDTDVLQAVKQF